VAVCSNSPPKCVRVLSLIIPLAVGGTPLSLWEPKGILYERAVSITKSVNGTIDGILWHQGESDAVNTTLSSSYASRFSRMIKEIRIDLNNESLPVVAGELGRFLCDNETRFPNHEDINSALYQVAHEVSNVYIVSSEGLSHKGDTLHFDTQSLREFGRRYAAAYQSQRSNL